MKRLGWVVAILLVGRLAAAASPSDLRQRLRELEREVRELKEARALKIAVINLNQLFDDLTEYSDFKVEFKAQQMKVEEELKALLRQVQDMEGDLRMLNPNSPEWQKKREKIDDLKRQYVSRRSIKGQELERRLLDRQKEVIDKVTQVVKKFAKEKHFTLVIRAQTARGPLLLSYPETMDITPDISKIMNDQYAQERRAEKKAEKN
jgi:Skp family chaperone for outer membrane proteins